MTTLYGIKNCDTVKKARTWLEQHKVDYRFHDLRADGLTATQVSSWIAEIGLESLINKRSTTWKELDEATKTTFSEATAPEIVSANPTLIKRPLLDTGKQKHVGFKDAEYEKFFN
jgi:arsenate reductase